MSQPDLILLHPPGIFRFREEPVFSGPISDVVPSSSIFEIYPIGFLTISKYLQRHGLSVRIVNLAMKMMTDRTFAPERFIAKLNPVAFGIDLHWLPHADGALSLAEMIKRRHPDKPVILGGLSATYYHEEIMRDYPFVDFIVCGDSTEEPLRQLIQTIKYGGSYESIPNTVWRADKEKPMVNEIRYRPENLDSVEYDYAHLFRMALKYHDPIGYIPFKHWLSYPVTAVFSCRGCYHNCGTCGGSLSAFQKVCLRDKPIFRSPELLAEDIGKIADYTRAPVMVLGDLLQVGEEYANRFLDEMRRRRIQNEIAIEFFSPPHGAFIDKVANSIENFNVEMSPESHDSRIRKGFGKTYTNTQLEKSLDALLNAGCKRIDLFFMVGLPLQDYDSVMETVEYCGKLLDFYGKEGRLLPMIAPLAPFIDPGSLVFEEPERFGYRLFSKTLREHRMAMLMPSWKYTLNYETEWMSRDDIVRASYDSALLLLDLKEKHGILEKKKAESIKEYIRRAFRLIERIDKQGEIDEAIRSEIFSLNSHTFLCDKHELEWPIRGLKLNIVRVIGLLFRLPFLRWKTADNPRV